jgi:hypothetical protein
MTHDLPSLSPKTPPISNYFIQQQQKEEEEEALFHHLSKSLLISTDRLNIKNK